MQAGLPASIITGHELGIGRIGTAVPVPASTMHAANVNEAERAPSLQSRATAACIAHALRDYVGQGLGRTAGLAIYCALAPLNELGLRVAAGVAGAAIGGRMAWRLASAQIGNDTRWQQAGVGCCTLLGAAAGGTIAALGTNHPVAGFAAGSLLAACASATRHSAADTVELDNANEFKAGTAIVGTLSGIAVATCLDRAWKVDTRQLPARNLGLVVESAVIETCKSSFERCGPSIERHTLNFEGRIVVALSGMIPYVAAAALLNGYVAGRLQATHDSQLFGELIAPTLVGAIANAVRGAANALAVCLLHRQQRFNIGEDRDCFRANTGIKRPRPRTVTDKACVRYFLSACRNALYARLRDAGYSVVDSNCIAQGVYACFAQCRDLINDLVRGDGWTEPAWRTRLAEGPIFPFTSTESSSSSSSERVTVGLADEDSSPLDEENSSHHVSTASSSSASSRRVSMDLNSEDSSQQGVSN